MMPGGHNGGGGMFRYSVFGAWWACGGGVGWVCVIMGIRKGRLFSE